MSHWSGAGIGRRVEWRRHHDFVAHYDFFLDATYPGHRDRGNRSRPPALVTALSAEVRRRGAMSVLDCAAGTGFPALDLASDHGGEIEVHCTDGDRAMVDVLLRRSQTMGIAPELLVPSRRDLNDQRVVDGLVLQWDELDHIADKYDYVLCRGNSLTYADTWVGHSPARDPDRLDRHLRKMADRVHPGGYLHIDAPWKLALADRTYQLDGPVEEIREQVTPEFDRRHWRVSFQRSDGRIFKFHRFSSHLTIHDVQQALDRLGFQETEPRMLPGERDIFGVIIARKPG